MARKNRAVLKTNLSGKLVYDFFKQTKLDNSLIVGYYGGGNFGDELLLETIQNLTALNRMENTKIMHLNTRKYTKYHEDFGNEIINAKNVVSVFKSVISSKNIIVGGGGIWGRDANINVLLLSIFLFIARHILRKKVYLIGVGFYHTATFYANIGGYIVSKSANKVIARDNESYYRFSKHCPNTVLGTDIAFAIPLLPLNTYEKKVNHIGKNLIHINKKTVLVSVRGIKGDKNNFEKCIDKVIKANSNINFLICTFNPEVEHSFSGSFINKMYVDYDNVNILKTEINPLLLYAYFKTNSNDLVFITPQYHAILSAHLNGIPYLPISYDNKVDELLRQIGAAKSIGIKSVTKAEIQEYIDTNSKSSRK